VWIAAAALICAAVGVSVTAVTLSSATSAPAATGSGPASANGSQSTSSSGTGNRTPTSGAPNARSGPAPGGAAGTVGEVSPSGFTLTTSAGQKVTVEETSSTTYLNGTSSTAASAITTGKGVLVLGMTDSTTITAMQIILEPAGSAALSSPVAAGVVPFQKGAATTSKQVGQVPANWSQGSGTIVSGTNANKATEAALAAYPGGVVDRVVLVSNGDYNVHYIGVNWPHHVFVSANFTVVGAL